VRTRSLLRLKNGSLEMAPFLDVCPICRLLKNNVLPKREGRCNRSEHPCTEPAPIIMPVDSERKDLIPDDADDVPSLAAGARTIPVGRVLGLDVGSRRIGVAVSDPLGITAQGLDTLQRTTKRRDFEHLQRVIQEYDVREIVVGLPLRMSGAEGIQSDKMQAFAEELRKRFRLPVHLWDERLTSVEANRLLREADLSIEKRGKAVDRMAAVLILQGWMERRAGASGFRLPASDSEY
jgi:putative holliday junction resolvase